MQNLEFDCFLVKRSADGQVGHSIQTITLDDLPAGEVVVQVAWSSLNYKDALATQGHPGVAGELPHVPGIDASGAVVSSSDPRYKEGDIVLVTGYEFGAPVWGGWSEYIRCPADWLVPMPSSLSPRDAMVLGTAGFTAAQCVRELQTRNVKPDDGPLLVTGATGGVGCCAVRLLASLGYEVHAVTGKESMHGPLKELGAREVHGRDLLQDNPKRPLLSARWAGGVDTVGGGLLVAFLKSTKINGCIAACGLVAGDQLATTIYPFILRGVSLAGVTSSSCPRPDREWIWEKLNSDWRIELPDDWVEETTLRDLPNAIERIGQGKVAGRVLVKVAD